MSNDIWIEENTALQNALETIDWYIDSVDADLEDGLPVNVDEFKVLVYYIKQLRISAISTMDTIKENNLDKEQDD